MQFDKYDTERIEKQYDLTRALLSTERGDIAAPFEREIDAKMKRNGLSNPYRTGCITVPDCVLTRALDSSNGSNLVPTYTQNIIPAIYTGGALARAGAQFLTVKSSVTMPTMPNIEPGWIAEGADAPELTGSVGALNLTPHTVAGYAKVTRRLMNQSPDGVKALTAEIVKCIRTAIERAVFSGAGVENEPLGLDNITGTTALPFTKGTPTRAEVNEAWFKIASKVEDPDKLRWVMDATSSWTLKDARDTDGDGRYLLRDGKLSDTTAIVSNVATPGNLYLADWTKLIVCNFGGIDLRVVQHDTIRGSYIIACFADVDFAFTRPSTFGVGSVVETVEG